MFEVVYETYIVGHPGSHPTAYMHVPNFKGLPLER
jgi:hypothetical protein